MTRFQIVAIFNDKILSAGEFNGDGYFEGGFGEDVCKAFATMRTEEQYREFAYKMNRDHFGYEEDIIYEKEYEEDGPSIDIFNFKEIQERRKYYDIWFSDYLYIINLSDEDRNVVSEEGKKITIHHLGWVTINFGTLYEQDDPTTDIKCMQNVTIDAISWIKEKIEDAGWKVDDNDAIWEIGKCTPAGEDFWFTVNTENILDEIKEYAEDFDVDEHVIMWVEARNSCRGVPSVRELLEDAEWIDNELQKLVDKLEEE